MLNLIPELSAIIGEQPPVPELAPQDAQNRFQTVFRRFLGVFAKPEHPLALFLDDLQWLDEATLALVERLVIERDVEHLLLVGAYRDNEVDQTHPLARTLGEIRRAGGRVDEIVLSPLNSEDIGRLVGDALHAGPERVQPLAELVFEKTAGNPFFAIQFVTALAEEKLLTFDPASSAWRWEIDRIRAKGFTDNVADLMAGKLSRLPRKTQEALGMLACLGSGTKAPMINLIDETTNEALWEAVRAGFVFRQDSTWSFIHDRVQDAAYGLIPELDRPATHLRIGRALAARTEQVLLEDNIFDIVNQLDRSLALITTQAEREQVATLNLMAGKRAKTSTAYASALQYLTAGGTLLAAEEWGACYELAFDLELNRAECEHLTGDPVTAEERLLALSTRARTIVDAAAVTCARLELYTALGRIDSAVEVGLEYLRRVDATWPLQVSNEAVRQEYDRYWQQLGSRPIESLVDLPLLADADQRATMNVLSALTSPAFFSDENLFHLVIARMAMLSLEHGNSDGSCPAYAWLGGVLGMLFGDYQTGYRFGQLALDLVEKRGLDRFKARVYLAVAVHAARWSQPTMTVRGLVQHAFEAAQDAGDLSYAAYSCVDLISILLSAGVPLGELEREAESRLETVRKVRFGLISEGIDVQLALIRILRGLTDDLHLLKDHIQKAARLEQQLGIRPQLSVNAVRYLQACIYLGDDTSALEAVLSAEPRWRVPTHQEVGEYHFYGALARARGFDRTASDERDHHFRALVAHHKQIQVWAQNCQETFADRLALVGAEIARLEGRLLDAECLYETAIRLARQHAFPQNEGLANELASRFYAVRGLETVARAYLRNARYCYVRWGAEGKVRQLDQFYPELRDQIAADTSKGAFGTPVELLDVATVVKASQAVSGEILLGRLLETLMTIALEHAGAERGALILLRGDKPQIEAEARTEQRKVEVAIRQKGLSPAELPEAIIHTVVRTRQSVILDDAQRSNPFAEDEYVQRRRPRSVLCLPLLKQAELVGLLYLENNLAPGIFTPQRTAVLELLASQAAISIENARLYAELINEVRDREKAEGALLESGRELRRSEALLAEAQRLSLTGSFAWRLATDEITWSQETYRLYEIEPTMRVTIELIATRIHPEDIPLLHEMIDRARSTGSDMDYEYRLQMPDKSVKYMHLVARATRDKDGQLEYIGAVQDVTERWLAQEALNKTQSELARVARLTTMGELAASIAHEINQPLAGLVMSADAGLRWLNRQQPELDEARAAFSRIASDGKRAGDVIKGLRSLARKSGPELAMFDIDDAIRQVLTLTGGTLRQQNVAVQADLFAAGRPVLGDRVQVQQVLLNLVMNGIEAMTTITDRLKALTIASGLSSDGAVLVSVTDTGTGLDAAIADRIFDALFTTKSEGMGMGLSICRSIVEAHGGHLWVSPNQPYGSVFQFTLPSATIDDS
jgi:predicted ATPase/signal transduction histidine kinase